jgi:hypothetical protein
MWCNMLLLQHVVQVASTVHDGEDAHACASERCACRRRRGAAPGAIARAPSAVLARQQHGTAATDPLSKQRSVLSTDQVANFETLGG